MKRSTTLPFPKMTDLQAWHRRKILNPETLEETVACLRAGKTLATLNGSFDLLHAGHLYILFEASKVADILLVCVNSDASVRAYKGDKRPIISLPYRMEMLSAIAFVDFVTSFEETDPRILLRKVRPDVHVNGAEYGENCIEADVVREIGARLHLVERLPCLATSAIVERIVQSCASSVP